MTFKGREGEGGWVRESLQGGDRGNDSWKLVQLRGREQFYHNNGQEGGGKKKRKKRRVIYLWGVWIETPKLVLYIKEREGTMSCLLH